MQMQKNIYNQIIVKDIEELGKVDSLLDFISNYDDKYLSSLSNNIVSSGTTGKIKNPIKLKSRNC